MSEEKSKKELELEKTREEARMLVEAKEKVEGDLLELKQQADSLNEEKDMLQSSTAQLQNDVEVCVHACLQVCFVYVCVCMSMCTVCVLTSIFVHNMYICDITQCYCTCTPVRPWQTNRNYWQKRNGSL